MVNKKIVYIFTIFFVIITLGFSFYSIFGKSLLYNYYYNLGVGTTVEADKISYFKRAVDVNSENIKAINELVAVFIDEEQYAEAKHYLKIGLLNNPDNMDLYLKQIKVYELSFEYDNMLNFALNIDSDFVNHEYKSKRPNTPTVDIEEGTYEESIRVSLSSNYKTFYKLNGDDYKIYKSPIVLNDGYYTLSTFCMDNLGFISEVSTNEYDIKDLSAPVNFTSTDIEITIKEQLENTNILNEVTLNTAKMIDLSTEVLFDDDIKSLINCRSLETLVLGNISNVTTLKELSKIETLTSITINKGCSMEIFSEILNMPKVEYVKILNSSIYNLPQSGITLETLIIKNSLLYDISNLENYKSLNYLDLSKNEIDKISGISSLKNLSYLDLSDNKIIDLEPLIGAVSINTLNLSGNEIYSINALSELTFAENLDISHNNVSSLNALANLRYLTKVDCSYNSIITLKPLSKIVTLEEIYATDNQIDDISYLNEFINLKTLELNNNKVDY